MYELAAFVQKQYFQCFLLHNIFCLNIFGGGLSAKYSCSGITNEEHLVMVTSTCVGSLS